MCRISTRFWRKYRGSRDQDQVHVVRHQAPRPHLDAGRLAVFGKQVAIERIVGLGEERPRPAVAALGDVVRMTGDDDTGETSNVASRP